MDLSGLLDEISSTRSSLAERTKALTIIEQQLATLCISGNSKEQLYVFIQSQDSFESNVASRIVAALASWLPTVHASLYTASDSKTSDNDGVTTLVQSVMQTLSILQGVSLLHRPSKAFLGRRWCIQLFLDLLLVSKYAPQPLESALPDSNDMLIPTPTLASSVVDTFLCVLADNPEATRTFEEAGGLDVVVRTLKRAGVSREVRMKCLEFLYFYLLPEDVFSLDAPNVDIPNSNILDTPSKPPSHTPLRKEVSPQTPPRSVSDDSSDEEHYAPNPKVQELRMLKKELDFVPSTPSKKSQVGHLGIGSPARARGPPSPATPSRRKRGDSETNFVTPSKSADIPIIREPLIEPRTPKREHRRGQSEATLFSLRDSSHSSLDLTNERTPSKLVKSKPITPIKRSRTEESVNPGLVKTPSRLHTRGGSLADATLIGNPMDALMEGATWSKIDEGLLSKGLQGKGLPRNRVRSTAEKTTLLGNYLGNVGALVEGMKKAGAWGLA